MAINPPPDTERKPQSEFFAARITDHGELSWMEIRPLASIGAGLLMRHLGDALAQAQARVFRLQRRVPC